MVAFGAYGREFLGSEEPMDLDVHASADARLPHRHDDRDAWNAGGGGDEDGVPDAERVDVGLPFPLPISLDTARDVERRNDSPGPRERVVERCPVVVVALPVVALVVPQVLWLRLPCVSRCAHPFRTLVRDDRRSQGANERLEPFRTTNSGLDLCGPRHKS